MHNNAGRIDRDSPVVGRKARKEVDVGSSLTMTSTKRAIAGSALALFSIIATAQDVPAKHLMLNIEAQPMVDALNGWAQQTGMQIIVPEGQGTDGLIAPSVKGSFTPQEALSELLNGTLLTYEFVNQKTIVIRARVPGRVAPGPQAQDISLRSVGSEASQTQVEKASDDAAAAGYATKLRAADGKELGPHGVETVYVTATKRTESVEDIPISIAVIGSQDIERRGVAGMEEYLRSVPGVSQLDRGFDNAIVIRGITTSPQSENFSSGSTVGSYFDETPITGAGGQGAGGIDVRPVDIERIEILRGPQGTAYGSASLGGTMRIIPAKPKLNEIEGRVAMSYSETSGAGSDNSVLQGAVNVPLVEDRFAVRVVGYRFDDSGFYRNSAGEDPATIAFADRFGLGDTVRGYAQDDVGRMLSTGGRVAALWQPTDKLTLNLNHLTQTIEQDGRPEASIGKFEQSRVPAAPQGRVRGETGEIGDTEIQLTNLVLNYDFGWSQLTSSVSQVDGSSAFVTVHGPSYSAVFGPSSTTGTSDFESVTAETRLASQSDGDFQFIAGVFYEDIQDDFLQAFDWPGTPQTNPFRTAPMGLYDSTRELEQRALFGEVSYQLTDKLTATVGGRYFEYDKEEGSVSEGGILGGVPIGAGVRNSFTTDESNSSFKANISYEPTPSSLLYVSWAEGFRLGRPTAGLAARCDANADGVVDGSNVTLESTRKIDSDFLENYEFGGKFELLDRRVVIDTSLYYIKWDGLPIRTIAPGCGLAYVANVGVATSTGMEFQASAYVTDALRFDLGGGYTEAELDEDAPALGAQEGARLPGSPKVSANFSAQYDFSFERYTAFVRADSFYVGELYGDLLKTPVTKAGDYLKVDARAGLQLNGFSLELFVKNLTNEDAYTWRGISARERDFGFRLRPRTVGFQLGYNFK